MGNEKTRQDPPPAARRGRPPSAETPERRQQIIAAATEIFGQQGYNGASFAAVAERVGLTLPGMLYYFHRKTDLLLAVLEERDRLTREMMNGQLSSWQDHRRALHELCVRNAGIPAIVRLFSILSTESLNADHPARVWFDKRTREVQQGVAGSIRKGQRLGEIRPDLDANQIATEICATMDGLQIWWLRMPDEVDLVSQFDHYLDRLDAAMRPAETQPRQ